MSYTPRSNKAEWHLTYRCDLSCTNCNRACFLPPQTPDMTLDDAREFCRQATALAWWPTIILIGGEPTLHPQFVEFARIAADFNPGNVILYSNEYSERSRRLVQQVQDAGLAAPVTWTRKAAGSVHHPQNNQFLAPADFGLGRSQPCGTHSRTLCGISVDAHGYTVCCCGGAIDGLLQLGCRTRNLVDLFNPGFARRQTQALCSQCGQGMEFDAELTSRAAIVRGSPMSPCWQAAAERVTGGKSASAVKPPG